PFNAEFTLTIDISLRKSEIDLNEVAMVNGFRVYTVERLIEQKLDAFEHRTHPRIRDLHDILFLAENYVEHFTQTQINKLVEFVSDPDELAYKFGGDSVDNGMDYIPLDDMILKFCDVVASMGNRDKNFNENKTDIQYSDLEL
ncbi:MAG: nucleotidyl transferase AbiEii/AbiGii toxin family protein, partial [Planctomycetota bacterium]|nr:nucleotidyl transferase AbiEii/AbiGii toxin family protein [Planctomycetota bacterium]